ncbi:hypothetical protein WR25_22586 [Diploscapter pachys]|uniref:Uncharacterized protein n=1 Tax=Diploscapter pachys TaxID=2018661 RepID=A0A2A2KJQ6_9BILA|nr:hypothetical protein WR25_22586 [Diploscapter pachys]
MSFLSSGRILSSSRPRSYNRLTQTQSSASASTSFTTDSIGDADANYQSQINKPRASIHSSASAPDLSATTRLIREKMKISSDGGLAEQHTSFPHFDSQYKCCCNAIHVRQGTQTVGVVCTIISTFGIFSTLFSKETPLVTALELLFLCIEVICIVFLFMALFNEKKNLLVPFMIWQFLSIIICIGLFIGCVNAIYKPDGYFGDWIQSYVIGQAVEVYSIDEKNEKRLEETMLPLLRRYESSSRAFRQACSVQRALY